MIKYDKGNGILKNWIVSESEFHPESLGKCEVIMSLGNGYMGLRSALEEPYLNEKRNWFVAGTFNKFDESEVTELPNMPDVTQIKMVLNGKKFTLQDGEILNYERRLNLKIGEVIRDVTWRSDNGETFNIRFRRFISLSNKHLMGMQIQLTPVDGNVEIDLQSGIDGQVNNSGVQHFSDPERRTYEDTYLTMTTTTTESRVGVAIACGHNIVINEKEQHVKPAISMERRRVTYNYKLKVSQNETFYFEKIVVINTSRDKQWQELSLNLEALKETGLDMIRSEGSLGYEELLNKSKEKWQDYWMSNGVFLQSENDIDELAVRFAQYHLRIMAPYHDDRIGIAAKGLCGEGYKGHSFWDTEIFILPYFSYVEPEVAKNLLKYRYRLLDSARSKALKNGYEGAMFPWETAWIDDGEVTPEWGAADVVTGEPMRIWTGIIEHHISADIAFAVWQYYLVSDDDEFMKNYGYEIIFETARFWGSRLEWNEIKKQMEICNVIGPDEYKEHVNNNAYTNTMAQNNMQLGLKCYEKIKENDPTCFEKLNECLKLNELFSDLKEKLPLLYVPSPNEDGILPQDDSYLLKKKLDVGYYRNQSRVDAIFEDYNITQLADYQVTKQADVLSLMFLHSNRYSKEIKKANWDYYEPKTLHDSSLSLSMHTLLACDIEEYETAYAFFQKAAMIDLGSYMKSSDAGIHAAAIGGIWMDTILGFGGIGINDGQLKIQPKLPNAWKELAFQIEWHGQRLMIEMSKEQKYIKVINLTKTKILIIEIMNMEYELKDKLEVKIE